MTLKKIEAGYYIVLNSDGRRIGWVRKSAGGWHYRMRGIKWVGQWVGPYRRRFQALQALRTAWHDNKPTPER